MSAELAAVVTNEQAPATEMREPWFPQPSAVVLTAREIGVARGTSAAVINAIAPYLNALHERLAEIERRIDEAGLAAALAELDGAPSTIEQRLGDLEQRIQAIEERPGFRYRGVWSKTEEYRQDEMVTLSGGLWIARASCCGVRPGTDEAWQLAVKRQSR